MATLFSSSGAYTGNAGIIAESDDGLPVIASNFVRRLRAQPKVDSGWFFHLIRSHVVQKYVPAHTGGSAIRTFLAHVYRMCSIPFVPDDKTQRRIAEILSTVDETIEQTEALIAKYQQIKAGLMHDSVHSRRHPRRHLRPIRTPKPPISIKNPHSGGFQRSGRRFRQGSYATLLPRERHRLDSWSRKSLGPFHIFVCRT